MRTKNSAYNIASNYIIFFIKTILTFWIRSVLISKISQTYIGLNGLFSNILSILSLAELGLSSAIGFSLYKPLMEKKTEEISSIMTYFKKTYQKIGFVILGLGVCIIPFLRFIVKESIAGMYWIYILFLINTCSLYFISYKDILISSDQKLYKLTKINLFFTLLISLGQLIALYITENFVVYLIVQFLISIIQRIFVNKQISKMYRDIKFDSEKVLDLEMKNNMNTNVKALCFHKIGDCMINATDNIIISTCINLDTVSVYSNYLLVISYLNTFATMIYNGILASLGNFLITETDERKQEIFELMNFFSFTVFGVCSVGLVNLFNPFIELLANKEYLLSTGTMLLIVLNFYITGMRIPVGNIKNAAGIFDIDKYTPLIQAIINIVFSVILAFPFGIFGVLLGTFISSIYPSIQRPCIVYKHILKKEASVYFKEYLKYFLFVVSVSIITFCVNNAIQLDSLIKLFFVRGVIAFLIYMILYVVCFRKNKNLINLIERFLQILKKEGA